MTDPTSHPPVLQSLPRLAPPPQACDSHAHICGPHHRFPPEPDAAYTPAQAPVEAYLAMLDRLGFARGVLVQATPYGFDNGAILDAVSRYPERLRAVALADARVDADVLGQMAQKGIRGLRFAHFPPGVKNIGGVGLDQIGPLSARMAEFGVHPQIWAPVAQLVEVLPHLIGRGFPVVLDHMARIDPTTSTDDPLVRHLLDLIRHEDIWVKLIPHRITRQPHVYADLRSFHDAFFAAAPDRMLWGSDWPFVRMGDATPDAGRLLNLFDEWTADPALRQAVLVDNPTRLYGFSPPPARQG